MNTASVGIRELKNNLSKYLRLVKSGETILITERGKSIGRIIPEKPSLEERMQGLVAAGIVRWNGKKFSPGKPVAINRGPGLVSDIVSENRDVSYLP